MTDAITNCTSCRFFKPIPMQRGAGMCRRHPPTTAVIGIDQLGAPQQLSFFPQVGSGVWCGEYTAALQLQMAGEVSQIETKGSA